MDTYYGDIFVKDTTEDREKTEVDGLVRVYCLTHPDYPREVWLPAKEARELAVNLLQQAEAAEYA